MTPIKPRLVKPTFRSSRPNDHVLPRSHTDAEHRRKHYGSLQPMDYGDESALARFSRLFAYAAMGFAGVIALYHVARAVHGLNLWFVL